MFQFIHAADFHLDSAFGALTARQAAARRRESRETAFRLANYVNGHGIGLVLLAGDLFDSGSAFRETGEQLAQALGQMQAKVFIAPGNHDWIGPGSPWLTVNWPENVQIFRENAMTAVDLPEWNLTIHGAAFTGPEQAAGLLTGFAAPEDGRVHIGLLHGEIDPAEARYDPIRREEIAASGLHYLALGHIHKRAEPVTLGKTLCAWPGCPEGRGFDECGEHGFVLLEIDGQTRQCRRRFIPIARRQIYAVDIDVTGCNSTMDMAERIEAELQAHAYPQTSLMKFVLVGELDVECEKNIDYLVKQFEPYFYFLKIYDETGFHVDYKAFARDVSLKGEFVRTVMKEETLSEEEKAEIIRYGIQILAGEEV